MVVKQVDQIATEVAHKVKSELAIALEETNAGLRCNLFFLL